MQRPVSIAFDVMGSDHGPAEVIRGAAQLSLDAPQIHALLVGDPEGTTDLILKIAAAGAKA